MLEATLRAGDDPAPAPRGGEPFAAACKSASEGVCNLRSASAEAATEGGRPVPAAAAPPGPSTGLVPPLVPPGAAVAASLLPCPLVESDGGVRGADPDRRSCELARERDRLSWTSDLAGRAPERYGE